MSDWGLSRAAQQIDDEAGAAAERLRAAPEDWRKWWKQRGENELRCILMTATYPLYAPTLRLMTTARDDVSRRGTNPRGHS